MPVRRPTRGHAPSTRGDHRRPVDGRSHQEVGVDRTETDGGADDLRRHGADAVVAGPGDLLPGGETG